MEMARVCTSSKHVSTVPPRYRLGLLTVLFLLHNMNWMPTTTAQATTTLGWTKETFPNPDGDPFQCHTTPSHRLCDPDAILTDAQKTQVDAVLGTTEHTMPHPCPQDDASITMDDDTIKVQYAVALVEKMDLSQYQATSDPSLLAAEQFARFVHDQWGVGLVVNCPHESLGTGVLIFLSIQDHTVYISRGAALDDYLSDKRLESVVDGMKSNLRKGRYGDAIVDAVADMDAFIASGKETFLERNLSTWLPVGLFSLCVFSMCYCGAKKQQRYKKVARQLRELDQQRQNKYKALSCPICLEPFQGQLPDNWMGSDGRPVRELPCGHAFDATCIEDWMKDGHGDTVGKCPICQQPIQSDYGATQIIRPSPASSRDTFQATPYSDNVPQYEQTSLLSNAPQYGQAKVYDWSSASDLYLQERAFRVGQLSRRYPDYVTPSMVERWSANDYSGDLSTDPDFVRAIPGGSASSSNGSGGGGSGFGGGSSSGGSGGHW